MIYRILFLLFAESRDLVPHRHPIYRDAYAIADADAAGAVGRRDGRLVGGAGGHHPALADGMPHRRSDRPARSTAGCLRARRRRRSSGVGRPGDRGARPSRTRRCRRRSPRWPRDRRAPAGRRSASRTWASSNSAPSTSACSMSSRQRVTSGRRRLRAPSKSARHSDRRKQTGTFYTPQSLCDFVVRRTLAPLVAGRSADADPGPARRRSGDGQRGVSRRRLPVPGVGVRTGAHRGGRASASPTSTTASARSSAG